MQATTLVPLEEYLRTEYDPDVDYVEGVLEERHPAERSHGQVQGEVYAYFYERKRDSRLHPFIEQRIRLSSSVIRVPDVCLVRGAVPQEEIFTQPPLVAIEVLSEYDRMGWMLNRIGEFLRFGVRYVWVVDPELRRAWVYTPEGATEAKDLVLRLDDPQVELPLKEIFAAIDANDHP
jgi:Uma2 family endonuclease